MLRKTKSSPGFLAVICCLAALTGAVSDRAVADEALDLIVNAQAGAISIDPLDPGTPRSLLFSRILENPGVGSQFLNDTGFDVFPGLDSALGPYEVGDGDADPDFPFSRLTIKQVGISKGLTALYQYDGVTPVFGPLSQGYLGEWILSENRVNNMQIGEGGFFFHQHFDFMADQPGIYFFRFQIVDAFLRDGTPVPDSEVFRIRYFTPGAVVPEPSAAAFLLSCGVPALWLWGRRARR